MEVISVEKGFPLISKCISGKSHLRNDPLKGAFSCFMRLKVDASLSDFGGEIYRNDEGLQKINKG